MARGQDANVLQAALLLILPVRVQAMLRENDPSALQPATAASATGTHGEGKQPWSSNAKM